MQVSCVKERVDQIVAVVLCCVVLCYVMLCCVGYIIPFSRRYWTTPR